MTNEEAIQKIAQEIDEALAKQFVGQVSRESLRKQMEDEIRKWWIENGKHLGVVDVEFTWDERGSNLTYNPVLDREAKQ